MNGTPPEMHQCNCICIIVGHCEPKKYFEVDNQCRVTSAESGLCHSRQRQTCWANLRLRTGSDAKEISGICAMLGCSLDLVFELQLLPFCRPDGLVAPQEIPVKTVYDLLTLAWLSPICFSFRHQISHTCNIQVCKKMQFLETTRIIAVSSKKCRFEKKNVVWTLWF